MRTIALCISLLLGALASPAAADDSATQRRQSAQTTIGGDRYAAGGELAIAGTVDGDLVAAGGRLANSAAVGGDALLAGGEVQIGARVARDLYAVGGQLRVNARIGRNARIAGGQVELGPQTRIGGNASLVGGELRLLGNVGGSAVAAGGKVRVDGIVDGDLHVTSDALELGPSARVGGKLVYMSRNEARIDPAATITGGVERRSFDLGKGPAEAFEFEGRAGAVGGIWTLGLVVLAAALVLALPALVDAVTERVGGRAGLSVLLGFAGFASIPLAVVLLLVTVIGVPLALLLLLCFFALLLLGYVTGAIALGDLLLRRGRAPSRGWRIVAAALVLVALSLLPLIPFVGWIVGPLVMFAGMGALLQLARYARRRRLADRI